MALSLIMTVIINDKAILCIYYYFTTFIMLLNSISKLHHLVNEFKFNAKSSKFTVN